MLTIQLTQEDAQRVMDAIRRDCQRLLLDIEGQANAQLLAAAAQANQPDVAGRMAACAAPVPAAEPEAA